MLLTIFNLPAQTRYNDVKSLIHTKCGFKDVILDNLASDSNNTKRVTVGLAEEEDAAVLMRKINGLYVEGQQLYVTTIKKKAPSTVLDLGPTQQQPMLRQPYYQQSNQPSYEQGYTDLQQSRSQAMLVPSMAYSGMYGAAQNATANYGYPQQMQHYQSTPQQLMAQSMLGYDQGAPLGFSNQGSNPSVWSDQNDWNLAGNASAGNQVTQQGKSSSRWENTGDNSSRSRRDAPARDSERVRPTRFGQEAGPRDAGRSAPRRDFGSSRDRGRDAPRDLGRDRDQDRDRNQGRDRDYGRDRDNGRDRGRDVQARDRGREPPVRNAPFREPPARNASFREPPVRNTAPRENNRDVLYNRRPEASRGPTKRQLSPPRTGYSAQGNSAPHVRTFSQQRGGPNANQPWGKPQPKQKKPDTNYTPPGKRAKLQAGGAQQSDKPQANASANTNQAQPGSKKKKVTDSLEKMKNRTETWRHQIASTVAKEIMNNPKHAGDDLPELLLQELKRGIRTRLEDLFGDNLKLTMPEMLQIYKGKFDPNNDTAFFNKAVEDAKVNGEKAAEAKKNAALAPDAKKKPVAAPVAAPAPAPAPVSADTTNTIPSYPGNKTINKSLKKANAQLFDNEEALLSQIDEKTRQAIAEEIDAMAVEVASEYDAIEPKPQFKNYFVRLKPRIVKDFKKMVKVNMAKRLLNIGPIMLRIFTVPKTISRGKLAPVLAKYGITSLRKSERRKPPVYYGTCDTYKIHDKLCSMPSIIVEGSSVLIKPFQLTGKDDRKKHRNRNLGSDFEDEDDSMSDGGEEFDEENDEDGTNEYDQNEDEGENENPETNDPEEKETDLADDEDTNGNIKMDSNDKQENIGDGDAETAQENEISETKNGTKESVSNENTEADNTDDTPQETAETKADENLDFTADVDINTGTKNYGKGKFKIDVHTNLEADKNLSEVNPEDLEELKGNIIDEIDMADLDDDDLEDW